MADKGRDHEGALRADRPDSVNVPPKYTLAPWCIISRVRPNGHFEIASVDINAGDYIANVYDERDARLIAAAPDLLEALRIIVSCDDESDFAMLCDADAGSGVGDEGGIEPPNPDTSDRLSDALKRARVAIAKATGAAR